MAKKDKSPAVTPAPSALPVSLVVLIVSLAVLVASIAASLVVARLDTTTQMVIGKVIETRTEQALQGRKRLGNREVYVVQVTISGKERTAKVAPPQGRSYTRSSVRAYYYPAMPWYVWYFEKSNGLFALGIVVASLGAIVAAFSGYALSRRKPSAPRNASAARG